MQQLCLTVLVVLVQLTFPGVSPVDNNVAHAWWPKVTESYLSYDELTTLLHELAAGYPNLVKIYSMGPTVEKREMWVANIRANITDPRPLLVPPVKIGGNIHGDESVSRAVVIMLILDLIRKYQANDKTVQILLRKTDIHLIPSFNPDGYEAAYTKYAVPDIQECEPNSYIPGRNNKNNFDLNRNFPDQYDEVVVTPEPETRNIMRHMKTQPFVLSLSLHGGAWVASYPYDSLPLEQDRCEDKDYHFTPDHKFFVFLAKNYANNHPFMSNIESKFKEGCEMSGEKVQHFPDGITNGAHWFTVYGGMQDYIYVNSNCLEITVEIACCKFPKKSVLHVEWQNNEKALYAFIKAAHMGIKGIAKDNNGRVLAKALVYVDGILRPVVTTERGEYWRPTLPGRQRYQIFGFARGYKSPILRQIVPNFTDLFKDEENAGSKWETKPIGEAMGYRLEFNIILLFTAFLSTTFKFNLY